MFKYVRVTEKYVRVTRKYVRVTRKYVRVTRKFVRVLASTRTIFSSLFELAENLFEYVRVFSSMFYLLSLADSTQISNLTVDTYLLLHHGGRPHRLVAQLTAAIHHPRPHRQSPIAIWPNSPHWPSHTHQFFGV